MIFEDEDADGCGYDGGTYKVACPTTFLQPSRTKRWEGGGLVYRRGEHQTRGGADSHG